MIPDNVKSLDAMMQIIQQNNLEVWWCRPNAFLSTGIYFLYAKDTVKRPLLLGEGGKEEGCKNRQERRRSWAQDKVPKQLWRGGPAIPEGGGRRRRGGGGRGGGGEGGGGGGGRGRGGGGGMRRQNKRGERTASFPLPSTPATTAAVTGGRGTGTEQKARFGTRYSRTPLQLHCNSTYTQIGMTINLVSVFLALAARVN